MPRLRCPRCGLQAALRPVRRVLIVKRPALRFGGAKAPREIAKECSTPAVSRQRKALSDSNGRIPLKNPQVTAWPRKARGRSMSVSDQGRGCFTRGGISTAVAGSTGRPGCYWQHRYDRRCVLWALKRQNDRARPILSAFLMPCLAIVRQEIDRTNLSGWRALTKHAWAHRLSLRAPRAGADGRPYALAARSPAESGS